MTLYCITVVVPPINNEAPKFIKGPMIIWGASELNNHNPNLPFITENKQLAETHLKERKAEFPDAEYALCTIRKVAKK